jgi:hypothetical protein
MTNHLTKAKEYRELARLAVERAQLEMDDRAQSNFYAIAESYLSLAELELKAAAQQQSEVPPQSTAQTAGPRSSQPGLTKQ